MDTKKLVFELCNADFIGSVRDCAQVVKRNIAPFVDEVNERTDGSVVAVIHGDERRIMLEAHIDQVGFVVTQVFKDGFLRVDNVGGPDIRTLPASELIIYGRQKVHGIVCSVPPHLQKGKNDKYPELSETYVDTGLGADAENLVSVGDFAVYSGLPASLDGDLITSKSLDDRAACAALILAAQKLSEKRPKSTVIFVFSQGEELNGCGASVSSFDCDPDCALACDVSFGYSAGMPEHKCGILSKGVMIGISPVLSRNVSNQLQSICQTNQIDYQLEVMGGTTSTDADHISLARGGVECGLVSIPLRYMHTPVEVVAVKDIESTARLMSCFVTERDGESDA